MMVVKVAEAIENSKFWKFLLIAQKVIMVISTVTVVLTLLGVVISRHVLNYNFLGYPEVLVIAGIWMYFIGSSYGSWEESHINADIVSQFVSEKTKLKLRIAAKIAQVIIGIPMVYLAYEMVMFDIEMNPTTIDLQVPLAFPHSAILISFSLMTFYSFVYILRDINELKEM
jgi:TRAP-type C4-dicarboxylate transport system permease small subunit